jgi:hypothetical protein
VLNGAVQACGRVLQLVKICEEGVPGVGVCPAAQGIEGCEDGWGQNGESSYHEKNSCNHS